MTPRRASSKRVELPESTRSATFALLALCLYTCVLFAPTLFFEFTYDDFIFFHPAEHGEDVRLKDPALADPSLLFSDGRWLGRSVRGFTMSLDYAVWGTQPLGYHLTNVLIHVAVVVAVFVFVRAVCASTALAGLAALFFAVHPVHTEVVANVSYRKDSLAFLAGLWCLFFFRKRANPWFLVLSLVLLGLTFVAKEVIGLSTFVALVLTDIFLREETSPSRRKWWSGAMFYLVLLAIGGGYALISGHAGRWGGFLERFQEASTSLTIGDVAIRSICAFGYNLRLLYVPWGYAPEHYPPWGFSIVGNAHLSEPLAQVDFYLGMLHIIVLPVLMVRLRRRKMISWSIAYFLGTYLTLFASIVFMKRLIAERYLYMPSLAFCVILAYLVWNHLRHSRRGFLLGTVGITVALSVSTVMHSLSWRDPFSLWKSPAAAAASSASGHPDVVLNFTHACGLTGRYEDGAEVSLRYLSRLRGKVIANPGFYENIASCLRGAGRLDESTRTLEQALRHFPGDAGLQDGLGLNSEEYFRRGDQESSSEVLSKLLELGDSVEVETYKNIAARLRGAGRLDESTRILEQALRYFPGDAGLQFDFGVNSEVYFRRGDRKSSSEVLLKLIELGDSVGVEIRSSAHSRLGLTAWDSGDFHAARDHLTEALRLSPTVKRYVGLAQVYFALGRLENARKSAQKALLLDGQNSAARELLRRIADRER